MSVRAYLPASLPLLADWVAAGEVPAGRAAHAVTHRLRDEYPDGGDEEWEYVALTTAAQQSVGLLDESAVPRRLVLAVDVPRVEPAEGEDASAVTVPGPVRIRDVAAVHVDSTDAEPVVAAAREVWHAGEHERDAAWDRCLDHELGWYATQEIDEVLRLGQPRNV